MLLDCEIVNCVRKRIDESKKIPNFSNYVVLPNEGLAYSLKQHRYIGAKNTKTGYWNCALYSDSGGIWNTSIHRVIWTAVNGPIPEGLQVNHLDENKSNNSIFNLNLMTAKENNNWATHNERIAKTKTNGVTSKPVGAFKDGELVMTFPSTREVQRQLGYNQGNIGKCCRGVKSYKTYKGYEWRYIETEKVSI